MDYLVIPAYEPDYNLIKLIKKFTIKVIFISLLSMTAALPNAR